MTITKLVLVVATGSFLQMSFSLARWSRRDFWYVSDAFLDFNIGPGSPSPLPLEDQRPPAPPPPAPSHNIFIPRGSRCWCKGLVGEGGGPVEILSHQFSSSQANCHLIERTVVVKNAVTRGL